MRNKIRVPRPHSCAVLETPGSNATRAANDTSSTWSVAQSGPLASITARMSLIAAQKYQAQLCHVTAHVGDRWKEVDTLFLIVRERDVEMHSAIFNLECQTSMLSLWQVLSFWGAENEPVRKEESW